MTLLPGAPELPNIQTLANSLRERFSGSTASTLTLQQTPQVGLELVFKNGVLLDPEASTPAYTIIGKSLMLHTALISSDVVHTLYPYSVNQ